jgi:hypothetical protein
MQRSSWVVSAVGFAAFLAACTPDVGSVTNPALVTIEFDPGAIPAVVPQPNNLALDPSTGLVNVPPNPGDTPTQTAFNQTYLDTLDGFPMESTATVTTSGDLDPASLASGVLVLDITNPAAPSTVTVTPSYTSNGADAGGGTLSIPGFLPGGQWQRAHTYAVVVIGGSQPGAVKGATGLEVTGSSTWGLIASTSNCQTLSACGPLVPLCAFPDGGPGGPGSGCLPTTDLIPSAADAAQLQPLQSGYAPLLAALAGPPFNIPRTNVAILWTFSITTQAEVTFDPANTVIPFPNDVVRNQNAAGLVNLPVPAGTPPILAQLIAGLNTLNGFSTTATITSAVDFSLPNDGVSALMQGLLDPNSISPPLAIGFAAEGASRGAAVSQGDPNFTFCLSNVPPGCPSVTATLPDGGVKPQMLGIVPTTPLDELTTYAAYMTNALRDVTGKPVIPTAIFALVRLPIATAPLADQNGKSQVSLLTDAQAQQLVLLQGGLAPLFLGLQQQGIPFTKVVQAWAFRTQSTISQLQALSGIPYAGFPANPLWVANVTAVVRPQLTAAGIPSGNIASIWQGEIIDPFALTGPGGTFNPTGSVSAIPMQFIMTVPTSAAPVAGYPVTMFGHGLGGNKTNAFAIANSLATAGQVMIAIDEVWHGERNTCTGFGAYLDAADPGGAPPGGFPDSAICTSTPTAATTCNAAGRCQLTSRTTVATCAFGTPTANETCFLVGQNECAPDGKCEGADFNSTFSGWNLLNLANLFATRDNFRQQVIDNSQFARVASGAGAGSLGTLTAPLNAGAISYAGQSLGGILGTLYTSVAFNVNNAGLNVPGGNPVNILLTSPAFSSLLAGFQGGLAEAGIVTNTPTYDLFIDIARWILDPADPTNMAYYTIHKTGIPSVTGGDSIPAGRRTFVQWIIDDQVVPNPTTVQLVQAALHNPNATGVLITPDTGPLWGFQFSHSSSPGFNDNNPSAPSTFIPSCNRHPFLLAPPSATCGGSPSAAGMALTASAQTQLVTFLSGVAPY